MPDVHPSHSGLPSLYVAEVTGFRGRWAMSVVGADRDVVARPNVDLGPANVLTVAHPDDPGRYLIAIDGEVPVLPREGAARHLEEHGFVVAASARADVSTDDGWTQIAAALWTAPCQPTV
ncbi:hypothetical protein [Streptomyces hypolithicus]